MPQGIKSTAFILHAHLRTFLCVLHFSGLEGGSLSLTANPQSSGNSFPYLFPQFKSGIHAQYFYHIKIAWRRNEEAQK